jgi:NhaP-type Na+/H+ or K+/H+ antiporter
MYLPLIILGLGYPYVLLPILLLKYPDAGESWSEWICIVLLYQIMVGTIVGILLGYAARKLLHYSDQRRLIEREALIVFACAFAVSIITTHSSDYVELLHPY